MKIMIDVEMRRIQDLLCCAMEGGSNYWCRIDKFNPPSEFKNRLDKTMLIAHVDYPTNPGGSLILSDREDTEFSNKVLDIDACVKGLNVMVRDYPEHFAQFMSGNEDANTGDIFLQCCLFEKVIFG